MLVLKSQYGEKYLNMVESKPLFLGMICYARWRVGAALSQIYDPRVRVRESEIFFLGILAMT